MKCVTEHLATYVIVLTGNCLKICLHCCRQVDGQVVHDNPPADSLRNRIHHSYRTVCRVDLSFFEQCILPYRLRH